MTITEYKQQLQNKVNKLRLNEALQRIDYLKSHIKYSEPLPVPLDLINATAQLSILENVYKLEIELGLSIEPQHWRER